MAVLSRDKTDGSRRGEVNDRVKEDGCRTAIYNEGSSGGATQLGLDAQNSTFVRQ